MESKTNYNKKIINATPITVNNIAFKSKLEAMLFKVLEDNGLNPKYESNKFVIWKGFKPTVPYYERNKKTKTISLNDKKLMDITYMPDFTFDYGEYRVFVEVKPDNFTNDVYPYKAKIFRKYLETVNIDKKPIFVKVGTKKNLLEFINILKTQLNEKSKRYITSNYRGTIQE